MSCNYCKPKNSHTRVTFYRNDGKRDEEGRLIFETCTILAIGCFLHIENARDDAHGKLNQILEETKDQVHKKIVVETRYIV